MADEKKKIVVIGGGTGTFAVLSGLKKYPVDLTAIVTMMDSGGSSGRLRDEFGQLPVGDVRQALVALSEDTSVMRQLFNYRYSKGDGLEGHSFGNLFLTALSEVVGGVDKALEETGKVLKIKGRVLPVTLSDGNLVAEYETGLIVRGEGNIDEPQHDGSLRIKKLWIEPDVAPYNKTLQAISEADLVVIGPGDLYTSLIPNLVVPKIADTIKNSAAKKIYIVNLMTKYGQTNNFRASDFVAEIEKYLGNCLDYIFLNNKPLPPDILQRYETEKENPVVDDLTESYFQVIRDDFLASDPIEKASGDKLRRSLIRHDAEKLAKEIFELV